jgi:hypothetical protein
MDRGGSSAFGWDYKRVLHRLLLKTQDLGKTQPWQELHVEDLLYGRLKLQERRESAAAQVHDSDAAFQLAA